MCSKTLGQLLADLGITNTHSRPHVSNDNPFSESQFKTMKYRPGFSGLFQLPRGGQRSPKVEPACFSLDGFRSRSASLRTTRSQGSVTAPCSDAERGLQLDRALKVVWCLEAQQHSAERLEISRVMQVFEDWHCTGG
jgi:hypothetical protein